MKGTERRIVVVKDTKSPYFDQAIFLVNPNSRFIGKGVNLSQEATKIAIDLAMRENECRVRKLAGTPKKRFRFDFSSFLQMGIAALIGVAAAGILFKF